MFSNPVHREVAPVSGEVLVAHWKMDEGTGLTTADSSGNGNDGTFENGLGEGNWATPGYDGSGHCINFAGGNGEVRSNADLISNEFRLIFRMIPLPWNGSNDYHHLVGDGSVTETEDFNLTVFQRCSVSTVGNRQFSVRTRNGGVVRAVTISGPDIETWLPAGSWGKIECLWKYEDQQVLINDVLRGTNNRDHYAGVGTRNYRIGRPRVISGTTEAFNERLDEILLYQV